MIAMEIIVAILVGGLVLLMLFSVVMFLAVKPPSDDEIRGATVDEVKDMPNDRLVLLALAQLLDQGDASDALNKELRVRATGKRTI